MNVDTCSRILSLCTGAGGLDLGVAGAIGDSRVVCYVENEVTAVQRLVLAFEEGWLDDAPVWTDLRTFDAKPWRGRVDGVTAGIPCQPHSVAGKGLGADDPRDLWPVTAQLLRDLGPRWFFLENVGGILEYYFERIRPDLQAMGYRVQEALVTAAEVGAPHRRERLFVLADRDGGGRGQGVDTQLSQEPDAQGSSVSVRRELADTERGGLERSRRPAGVGGTQAIDPRPEEERERDGDAPRDGSEELADTGHAEREGRLESPGGSLRVARGKPASQGRGVADAERPRRETAGARAGLDTGGEPQAFSGAVAYAGYPSWPPGPDDLDAWRFILAGHPDLAPATPAQSSVCRVDDGLAGRVDECLCSRTDELRITGNGVVPQQAEYAFRLLAGGLA